MADGFKLEGYLYIKGFDGLEVAVGNLRRQLASQDFSVPGLAKVSRDADRAAKSTSNVRREALATATSMQDFADKAGLALRRFTAFSIAAGATFGSARLIFGGLKNAAQFERELIKVQQVSNASAESIAVLRNEISRLGASLGAPSKDLANVSVILSQAGFSINQVKTILESVARTRLAATFGSIENTVEGIVAITGQFKINANDIDDALASINATAAKFAVESDQIISAIRRAGGVFAAASTGIDEGTTALAKFNALFSSVIETTRQAPETVATGLRTVIARLQRPETIDFFRNIGVELRDLEGKFVGPFQAIQNIGQAIQNLNPRSPLFAEIVEVVGGVRQMGVVVPLLKEWQLQQEILNVTLREQGQFIEETNIPLKSLTVQFEQLTELWNDFSRDVYNSSAFQVMAQQAIDLAKAFVGVADSLAEVLPLFAALGAARLGANIFKSGAANIFTKRIVTGHPGLLGFNSGGYIGGTGSGDKQLILAEAGEFVIRKNAAKALGRNALGQLNNIDRFASGGIIGRKHLPAYADGGEITSGSGFFELTKEFRNIAKTLGLTNKQFIAIANEIRGTAVDLAEARKLFRGAIRAAQYDPNLKGGGASGGAFSAPFREGTGIYAPTPGPGRNLVPLGGIGPGTTNIPRDRIIGSVVTSTNYNNLPKRLTDERSRNVNQIPSAESLEDLEKRAQERTALRQKVLQNLAANRKALNANNDLVANGVGFDDLKRRNVGRLFLRRNALNRRQVEYDASVALRGAGRQDDGNYSGIEASRFGVGQFVDINQRRLSEIQSRITPPPRFPTFSRFGRGLGRVNQGINRVGGALSNRALGLGAAAIANEYAGGPRFLTGALGGASTGAVAGPYGALAGAVIGGVGGQISTINSDRNKAVSDRLTKSLEDLDKKFQDLSQNGLQKLSVSLEEFNSASLASANNNNFSLSRRLLEGVSFGFLSTNQDTSVGFKTQAESNRDVAKTARDRALSLVRSGKLNSSLSKFGQDQLFTAAFSDDADLLQGSNIGRAQEGRRRIFQQVADERRRSAPRDNALQGFRDFSQELENAINQLDLFNNVVKNLSNEIDTISSEAGGNFSQRTGNRLNIFDNAAGATRAGLLNNINNLSSFTGAKFNRRAIAGALAGSTQEYETGYRGQLLNGFDRSAKKLIDDTFKNLDAGEAEEEIKKSTEFFKAVQDGANQLLDVLAEGGNQRTALLGKRLGLVRQFGDIGNEAALADIRGRGGIVDPNQVIKDQLSSVGTLTNGFTDPRQIGAYIRLLEQRRDSVQNNGDLDAVTRNKLLADYNAKLNAANQGLNELANSTIGLSAIQEALGRNQSQQGALSNYSLNSLTENPLQRFKEENAFRAFQQGDNLLNISRFASTQDLQAGINRKRQELEVFGASDEELRKFDRENAIKLNNAQAAAGRLNPDEAERRNKALNDLAKNEQVLLNQQKEAFDRQQAAVREQYNLLGSKISKLGHILQLQFINGVDNLAKTINSFNMPSKVEIDHTIVLRTPDLNIAGLDPLIHQIANDVVAKGLKAYNDQLTGGSNPAAPRRPAGRGGQTRN